MSGLHGLKIKCVNSSGKKVKLKMNNNENELFEAMLEKAVAQNFEDELAAIPPREELEKMYAFSDRHNARMEKLFEPGAKKARLRSVVRYSRSVAAILAVTIAVAFGGLLFNPQVRAAVGDTIVQWFDLFAKFISVSDEQSETVASEWRPAYLPEGFSEEVLMTGDINLIQYTNIDGAGVLLTYMMADNSMSVNSEGVEYNTLRIEGVDYHMFEASDADTENIIVWEQDGNRFQISSLESIIELQKIAMSVRPQK
jgi:hypothetical protein